MNIMANADKWTHFKDIEEGQVFTCMNDYYMKISIIKQDFRFYNAVKLSDGSLSGFKADTFIIAVDGSFQHK